MPCEVLPRAYAAGDAFGIADDEGGFHARRPQPVGFTVVALGESLA
jgi:hypothetical protein